MFISYPVLGIGHTSEEILSENSSVSPINLQGICSSTEELDSMNASPYHWWEIGIKACVTIVCEMKDCSEYSSHFKQCTII